MWHSRLIIGLACLGTASCVLKSSGTAAQSTPRQTELAASGSSSGGSGPTSPTPPPIVVAPAPPIVVAPPPGGPGCGLAAAAFCDTFDAPSAHQGRAGELDATMWSLGRASPQLPTTPGIAFPVGPATLPECRAGLPAKVFPDSDSLICDANASIASTHLLVAVGAQNYGQNSYRIRQPFDFTDRTGTIAFDAEAYMVHPLIGWIAIEISEDPTPVPGFAIVQVPAATNDEGSAVPRNAIELHFSNQGCALMDTPHFGLGLVDVITNYHDAVAPLDNAVCVPTQQGHLNHFEIKLSKSHVEVYATPFSPDGTRFDPEQLVYSGDITLPFSRGYVSLTTHNHAALKYSGPVAQSFSPVAYDAWFSRWDNVGFDGPRLLAWREYEIADSLAPGDHSPAINGPVMSIGYALNDMALGPRATFHFHDVDITGATSARMALTSCYNFNEGTPSQYDLRFRLNGGPWHDRLFTADELAQLTDTASQGTLSEMLDVPVADLVAGDNSLEFVSVDTPTDYALGVSNIDLILATAD